MLEHVQTSMLCKKMYGKTAPSHAAKWQETTNCLACQKIHQNQCSTLKFTGKQRPDIQPRGRKQKMCQQARKHSKILAFCHAHLQQNSKCSSMPENVRTSTLCIDIGSKVNAEPCSKVPGHSKCSSMLDNLRKSMFCIENYSNTAPSHAAKQQKQQICQKFIYSKTAPSHAAKCQETTNVLACQKISEHQWFTLKCTAKRRPAMQRSCRKHQNF